MTKSIGLYSELCDKEERKKYAIQAAIDWSQLLEMRAKESCKGISVHFLVTNMYIKIPTSYVSGLQRLRVQLICL